MKVVGLFAAIAIIQFHTSALPQAGDEMTPEGMSRSWYAIEQNNQERANAGENYVSFERVRLLQIFHDDFFSDANIPDWAKYADLYWVSIAEAEEWVCVLLHAKRGPEFGTFLSYLENGQACYSETREGEYELHSWYMPGYSYYLEGKPDWTNATLPSVASKEEQVENE